MIICGWNWTKTGRNLYFDWSASILLARSSEARTAAFAKIQISGNNEACPFVLRAERTASRMLALQSLNIMKKYKRLFYSTILCAAIFFYLHFSIFAQDSNIKTSPVIDAPIDVSAYKLKKVYANDFSKNQKIAFEKDFIKQNADGNWTRTGKPSKKAEWIAEGSGGVEVRSGQLRASPVPFDENGSQISNAKRSHLVVWNKNIFPADFLLEYEMNPNSSPSGLTIIFFLRDGQKRRRYFRFEFAAATGQITNFTTAARLANYSDSYFSRNTEIESLTNRLRKNPGFKLVAEGKSLTTGATEVTHHIKILKFSAHIEIEVDGKTILRWDDSGKPLGAGRIGLRSMEGISLVSYDNFKVWRLTARK